MARNSDRRKDDDDDGDDEARWLTTYGDAMTLLLVFFILLLSMSEIDPDVLNVVITSFQGSVGIFEAGRTVTPAELMDMGINVQEMSEAQTTIDEQIPERVEDIVEFEDAQIQTRQDERGLVIQITDRLLFEQGEVAVTPQGEAFLNRLSQLLMAPDIQSRQLRVEGHTDDVDPLTRYSSNWEISSLRATNVVEVLQGFGVEDSRLSAVGYGETRPVADNNTPEGRATNRRVEVVVLRDDVGTSN